MRGIRKALLAGVGVVGAGVLVVAGVLGLQSDGARAQEAGATPLLEVERIDGHGGWYRFHGRGFGDGEFLAALAAQLGITEDELRTAVNAVADDRLQAKVEDGTLTQEQADDIRERRAAIEEAIANGTLDELLREQARVRIESRLATAVEAGHITQAQLETLLAAYDDGDLRGALEELGLPGFRFRGFGPRGFHEFRFEGPGLPGAFGDFSFAGSST